jgi:hypothetical protein
VLGKERNWHKGGRKGRLKREGLGVGVGMREGGEGKVKGRR